MGAGELILLLVAWTLMAFTLGALVTWRLEGRRPLVAPLWLVVLRNLGFISMAVFIVVAADPPAGIVTVEPLVWNALKAMVLIGAVAALPLELRHALRNRQTS